MATDEHRGDQYSLKKEVQYVVVYEFGGDCRSIDHKDGIDGPRRNVSDTIFCSAMSVKAEISNSKIVDIDGKKGGP